MRQLDQREIAEARALAMELDLSRQINKSYLPKTAESTNRYNCKLGTWCCSIVRHRRPSGWLLVWVLLCLGAWGLWRSKIWTGPGLQRPLPGTIWWSFSLGGSGRRQRKPRKQDQRHQRLTWDRTEAWVIDWLWPRDRSELKQLKWSNRWSCWTSSMWLAPSNKVVDVVLAAKNA
jgi:hypothetical protein